MTHKALRLAHIRQASLTGSASPTRRIIAQLSQFPKTTVSKTLQESGPSGLGSACIDLWILNSVVKMLRTRSSKEFWEPNSK